MAVNAKIKVKARLDARSRRQRSGRVKRGGYGKKETQVNLTMVIKQIKTGKN